MKREELLQTIENFLLMTGMKPYRFGMEAMGDPNFVFEIRKGRRCYDDTEARLMNYMRLHSKSGTPKSRKKRAG